MTPPPDGAGHPRRRAILAAVMLGAILGPIDASIVNVILPTLTRSLGASLATAQWVPMAYLLSGGSLVLLFGRLGDLWGTRHVFLAGLLGFVGASALCGAAPTIGLLVAFRALQGLAAGMMMSVPLAILTRVFPKAERGRTIGLFASSISAGLALGPSLGGFLAAAFGWRAAFFVNVPIGLAAFLVARRVLPAQQGDGGRMDLPGAATALGALGSFLLCVNRAQQEGLGRLPLVLLALSVALGAAFVAIERRTAEPMVSLGIFRGGVVGTGSLAAVLNFMSQYVVVFLTPFLLARLLHAGPGRVGVVMTAFPLTVLCVAPFAGALSDRVGTVALAAGGASVCALSGVLLAALPKDAGPADLAARLALFGLGTGIFQSPNNSAVMGSAPRAHLGVVSSLLGTARSVGMVLGVAVAGAILYAHVPAAALRVPDLAPEHVAAFVEGSRTAYGAGAVFAAASALLSLARGRRRAPLAGTP